MTPARPSITRRGFLAAAAASAVCLPHAPARASGPVLRRPVPSSGELLPAVGMGTWITFNVGGSETLRRERAEVLRTFFALGGTVIDSSPMYGSSEEVLGWCLERIGAPGDLVPATKVWTPAGGTADGQIGASERLWRTGRIDIMQVHNLVDWERHLDALFAAKAEGRIRYVGVTTSHGRRHAELERVMRDHPLDFVQLTYNIVDREAEARLLPLAAERGIGVIVNRPYRQKQLFRMYESAPLPGWAQEEAGAANWAEFFLKFILSHPAVTCAIPATTRADHMRENMGALHGPLPDARTRQRMAAHVAGL